MTAPYALIGEVLTPEAVGPAAVMIQGGKIIDLLRSPGLKDLPPEQRTVSGTISPGFIDLQINGAFGIDVGPDAGGLRTLVGKLPQTGTTSFPPTAISWPAERYEGALRLALVTDAMEAAGMAEGEYELSGRRVRLENGSVRLSDGTLAGSALTMDRAVRKAVRLLGISLENAVRMVSETAAEILGLPEKGRVAPGADADLVVLSPEGVVEETIVAGETVYHGGEGNHAG